MFAAKQMQEDELHQGECVESEKRHLLQEFQGSRSRRKSSSNVSIWSPREVSCSRSSRKQSRSRSKSSSYVQSRLRKGCCAMQQNNWKRT